MFTLEELESIEPESARVMDILEFVKLDEIDPFYFDASYYVAPEPAGIRAYHLLLNAMRKTGYAAIAKATMHNREYIVIVRARKTGLALHTMFYPNEVRSASDLKIGENTEVKPQEEALAEQLIKNLAVSFKPEKFSDSYQEGLKKLIEAKTHGKTLAMPSHKNIGPVIDLMSALKKSLGEKEKPKTLMKAVPQRGESRKKQRKTG
jgi:DNA end-binding protein Ku